MSRALRPAVGLLAIGLLLAGAACSREMGRKFDMSAADSLQPGVSTLQDAVAALGPPTAGFTSLSGREVAQWSFLKDCPRGTESASLMILFGANGRMIAVTRREERKVPTCGLPNPDGGAAKGGG